ncbi:hypothetical protein H2200_000483 [Cladophialophora chaetospira]|uniref:C2H2-type domain-containing protein n=1 Tax=Cladophialophora chaetospira TaxID=386627 RepID=A0AA39CP81_9EURO|nr:hypothetical protein H2200_000483 [Cladophialophora chaetospira]
MSSSFKLQHSASKNKLSTSTDWQIGLTPSSVYQPYNKLEDNTFDILTQLDTDFDRDSSFEYVGDCSSLSSSYFSSFDGSVTAAHEQRRPSLASSIHSSSHDNQWTPSATSTSPQTPILVEPDTHLPYRPYVKPTAYLTSSHVIFHDLQNEEQNPQGNLWSGPDDSSLPLLSAGHDMTMAETAHPLYQLDINGLSHANSNPALTPSIFENSGLCTLTTLGDEMLEWKPAAVRPVAETIEPSVAFQATVPASPAYKIEPSTPLHGHISPSIMFSSSPASIISPRVVPSQYDLDDLAYNSLHRSLSEVKKQRAGNDRLHRRAYERKRPAGSSSKLKASPSKTGLNCALVIEQNEFACTYPDCLDKKGLPKRFKRQEHKKRHEKTVHEKDEMHKCWVAECGRGFSRTDNLKSHLRNTHSKRPGVRGNRYVATLDKNSEFYDPEWVGELDKNGYPLSS